MRPLPLLLALLLLPAPATAQYHLVNPGDTLWEIARLHLADPFRWPEIFALNRDLLVDPDRLAAGVRLRLPVAPAGGGDYLSAPPEANASATPTVFFPAEEEDRATGLPSSPSVTTGDDLRAGRIVPDSAWAPVGVVVAAEGMIVRLRMREGGAVGDTLQLWRAGREVAPFGRLRDPTAIVRVTAADGVIVTARAERLFTRPAPGDQALPRELFRPYRGVTSPGLEGRIVAFGRERMLYGVGDLVYVDLALAEGDLLEVPGVARLRVVRGGDRTSTARVVSLTEPSLRVGMVVRTSIPP